jgi:hypothetical protein
MAELMQHNIVGNFLNAYQSGLERQEAQKAAERQRMRQDRSDQMAEQRFQFDMDAGQLDMALRRGAAMNEILAGVDERNPQTLEIAKQRYLTTFGGKPEDVAQITMADIPRIKLQTGQTLKELELRFKQAQIGTEQEQGRAARALTAQRYAAASGGGAGGSAPGVPATSAPSKPMATPLQAAEDKDIDALQGANSLKTKVAGWRRRFEKGGLETGPVSQLARIVGTQTGLSTTNSRELQLFQNDLESMRNDSLRLNAGVQTEGDAIREWNALIAGLNDQDYVIGALKRIEQLNAQAAALKMQKINIRRQRNNFPLFDPASVTLPSEMGLTYQGGNATAQGDDFSDVDALLGLK